jgi:hypothetical protein
MNTMKLKNYVLWVILLLPIILLYTFGNPIVQVQEYHQFADQINYFGIPNFHNVISNLAFIATALIAFRDYFSNKKHYSISWLIYFIGVLLVAPGSAFYHWMPSDFSLVWDRLPMTVAFMGILSCVLCELYKIKNENKILIPLVLFGIYTVIHWVVFNDLRIYYWVQLSPILAFLYVSLAMPTKSLKTKHLLLAVGLYVIAKMTEKYDDQIFETIKYSGHSIKHLVAAVAVYVLILMKRERVEVPTNRLS